MKNKHAETQATTLLRRRKQVSALFKAVVIVLSFLAVLPLVLIFFTLSTEGFKGMNSQYTAPVAMVEEEQEFFFYTEEGYVGPVPTQWLPDTSVVTNKEGQISLPLGEYFGHTNIKSPLTYSYSTDGEGTLTGTITEETLTISYPAQSTGDFSVEVIATDAQGHSTSDTMAISLKQGPYVPQAQKPIELKRNGAPYSLDLKKHFGHTTSSAVMTFSASSTKDEILSAEVQAGVVTLTPTKDSCGLVTLYLTAEDEQFQTLTDSVYVTINGTPFFHISNFLTALPEAEGELGGGILNALVGSLMLIIIAVLIALPLGVLGGFYLAEHPTTKAGETLRLAMEILQGVPSIVIGIIINLLFVMKLRLFGSTFSALAGGVALAIMMLPVLVRTTEETLKMLPKTLKEASLALGAPYYHTVFMVLLPAGLNGIMTGLLISVARIAGETAPLLFTSFGNDLMNYSPLKPIAALPLYIYRYAVSSYPVNQQMAWGASAVLIIFILGLNFAARIIAAHFNRHSAS